MAPVHISTAELLQATHPRASYLGPDLAPHAYVGRASLTVPAAKRAVARAYIEITRITAATTPGRAFVEVLAGGTRIARVTLNDNAVGASRRAVVGPVVLAAGETIEAFSEDASTGGTLDITIGLDAVQWGLA